MDSSVIGFIVWCAVGCVFLCLAIVAWFSKKPVGFWANAQVFEPLDVKKYNHAVAKLFFVFGMVLTALGIPLLAGQNSAWALLSVAGVLVESIVTMAVYALVIEKKYKNSGK